MANEYGEVPESLIKAIRHTESGNRPDLTSRKGARHEMQVMPAVAKKPGFGIRPARDDSAEEYNRVGEELISTYWDKYRGDVPLVAAAYNAGSGAVDRHGGVPPYDETLNYIRKVTERMKHEDGQDFTPEEVAQFEKRYAEEQAVNNKEFTPEEVAGFEKRYAEEQAAVAPEVPAEDQPSMLGEAFRRGVSGVKQAGQGVVTGALSALGQDELVQQRMAEQEALAKSEAEAEALHPELSSKTFQNIQDIAEKDGTWEALKQIPGYVGQKIAESAPSTATPLGVGMAVGMVNPALGVAAGITASIVQEFGFMMDRQIEKEKLAGKLEPEKAAIAAIPAGILDSIADRFTLGMKLPSFLTREVKEGAVNAVTKTFGGEVAKHVAKGVISETPTEMGQTELERWQADEPLSGPENLAEVKEAGISAGVSGGAAGAIGGTASYLGGTPTPEATTEEPFAQPETAVEAPAPEPIAPEGVAPEVVEPTPEVTAVAPEVVEPTLAPTPDVTAVAPEVVEPVSKAEAVDLGLSPDEFKKLTTYAGKSTFATQEAEDEAYKQNIDTQAKKKAELEKLKTIVNPDETVTIGGKDYTKQAFIKSQILHNDGSLTLEQAEQNFEALKPKYSVGKESPSKISDRYPDATPTQKARLDMPSTKAVKVIPELLESARKVARGEATNADHQAVINKYKPVTPYNYVPTPETDENMALGLKEVDKIAKLNQPIAEGEVVDSRLDIPAYTRDEEKGETSAWVPTLHTKDRGRIYRSTVILNNFTMKMPEQGALNIATRKETINAKGEKKVQNKAPIATIRGEWENHTPEQAYTEATKVMADYNKGIGNWRQAGMDPDRHSHFYDRETQQPIVGGDRMIQIGPLVLVKNAIRGDKAKEDYLYSAAPTEATTGHTTASLSKAMSPELKRLVASGKAVIHDTQATLPGTNHPANVKGMTTAEGVTHYVANKLTPSTMESVALHEVGVHAGMEKMLGKELWEDVKNQALNGQGKEFDRARAAVPASTPTHLKAEETLAYLVEHSPQLSLVRRIVAAIRNFMRSKMGMGIKLSEADARQIAVASMRREATTAERTAREETAFSKKATKTPSSEEDKIKYSMKQTFEDEIGSFKKQSDSASDKVFPGWLRIFSASGVYELAGEGILKGGKAVLKATRELAGLRDKMLTEMAKMRRDSFNPYIKKNHKQLGTLGDVMSESTLLGVSPRAERGKDGNIQDRIDELQENKPTGYAQLISRLQDLRQNYDKNLNTESKRVYDELAKYYENSLKEIMAAYENNIQTSGAGVDTIDKQLAKFQEQMGNLKGKGDYFPLMRFGKFGVAYKDGEVDPVTGKEIEKFTKFDTSSEAKTFLANKKINGYLVPDIQKHQEEMVGDNKTLQKLYDEIEKTFADNPADAKEDLKDFVFQMHLMGKSNESMAKQFIHRKGTPGYSNDVFRAFDNYAMNLSRQLPRIQLGRTITNGLRDIKHDLHGRIMRREFEGDVEKANSYFEAFDREITDALHPKITGPLSNFATGAAFSYYLTSPASAILQLTSVALQGIPSIGKTHGYILAHAAMNAATKMYLGSGIGRKEGWWNMERGAELYKKKHGDYKKLVGDAKHADQTDIAEAMRSFVKEGIVTSGIHAEAFSGKGRTTGAHENIMQKAVNLMDLMSQPFAQMESASRQIVATAAYIANMKSGMTHDKAVESAIDSVYRDMGDFGSTGRSTLTKSDIARVVWQFQQYGAKLLFSMGKSAIDLATKQGHTRKEAIKHLAGLMGMHWIFAGVLGLPAAGMIGAVGDMLKDALDDDEWHNYKADLRSYLEAEGIDRAFINILLDGPLSTLTNIKLSERLGAHEILPIIHESQTHDTLTTSTKENLFDMFGGAAGSLAFNISEGVGLFTKGETERAIEKLVPNAIIKNALTATRYATEGKMNLKGEEVIPKENFSAYDLALQAMGFAPYKVFKGEESARAAKTDISFIEDKRTKLLSDFRKAREEGNTDEALDNIRKFNEKYSFTPITGKNLKQSVKTAARAKATAIFGMNFGKGEQAMKEKYAGMVDEEDFEFGTEEE